MIESHWTADGASCLEHRRTWTAPGPLGTPTSVDEIRTQAAALVQATMRHAMPEADPPPALLLPPSCSVGTSAGHASCASAIVAAYAARERVVTAAIAVPAACPASEKPVWTTFPVNHVSHRAP